MGILKEEIIGGQRLILGDCLTVMPLLGEFDHVISDPPYEAIMHDKLKKQRAKKSSYYDHQITDINFEGVDDIRDEIAENCTRLSNGWSLIFCMAEGVGSWRDSFELAKAKWKRTLIWIKPDGMPQFNGQSPAAGYECMALSWCGSGHSSWNGGGAHGTYTFSKGGKVSAHPTEKPIKLMAELVRLYSNQNQTILDPFMGSGTTLVACQKLGRKGTGIELDPDYFAIACKRVDEATRQPDLFVESPKPEPTQGGFL